MATAVDVLTQKSLTSYFVSGLEVHEAPKFEQGFQDKVGFAEMEA